MQMCTKHWKLLRTAITSRGLGALVADSEQQAISNFASELENGQTVDNYDPLMGAHNAILNNAMDALGPSNSLMLFSGDYCPLCVLNQLSRESWETHRNNGIQPGQACPCGDPRCNSVFPAEPKSYDEWIDFAADEQANVWRSLHGNADA